ncbi:hypothetical protein CSUI_004075 [Cystoisospora suis]|uniref:Uncharacterized protein n=1 Tax=Cystoisospora suis TaxID=483139 RepID=A0A2C6KYI6_9APIC|nr:hypothetical protein CSUI_004075 [Cystoisospora suis]
MKKTKRGNCFSLCFFFFFSNISLSVSLLSSLPIPSIFFFFSSLHSFKHPQSLPFILRVSSSSLSSSSFSPRLPFISSSSPSSRFLPSFPLSSYSFSSYLPFSIQRERRERNPLLPSPSLLSSLACISLVPSSSSFSSPSLSFSRYVVEPPSLRLSAVHTQLPRLHVRCPLDTLHIQFRKHINFSLFSLSKRNRLFSPSCLHRFSLLKKRKKEEEGRGVRGLEEEGCFAYAKDVKEGEDSFSESTVKDKERESIQQNEDMPPYHPSRKQDPLQDEEKEEKKEEGEDLRIDAKNGEKKEENKTLLQEERKKDEKKTRHIQTEKEKEKKKQVDEECVNSLLPPRERRGKEKSIFPLYLRSSPVLLPRSISYRLFSLPCHLLKTVCCSGVYTLRKCALSPFVGWDSHPASGTFFSVFELFFSFSPHLTKSSSSSSSSLSCSFSSLSSSSLRTLLLRLSVYPDGFLLLSSQLDFLEVFSFFFRFFASLLSDVRARLIPSIYPKDFLGASLSLPPSEDLERTRAFSSSSSSAGLLASHTSGERRIDASSLSFSFRPFSSSFTQKIDEDLGDSERKEREERKKMKIHGSSFFSFFSFRPPVFNTYSSSALSSFLSSLKKGSPIFSPSSSSSSFSTSFFTQDMQAEQKKKKRKRRRSFFRCISTRLSYSYRDRWLEMLRSFLKIHIYLGTDLFHPFHPQQNFFCFFFIGEERRRNEEEEEGGFREPSFQPVSSSMENRLRHRWKRLQRRRRDREIEKEEERRRRRGGALYEERPSSLENREEEEEEEKGERKEEKGDLILQDRRQIDDKVQTFLLSPLELEMKERRSTRTEEGKKNLREDVLEVSTRKKTKEKQNMDSYDRGEEDTCRFSQAFLSFSAFLRDVFKLKESNEEEEEFRILLGIEKDRGRERTRRRRERIERRRRSSGCQVSRHSFSLQQILECDADPFPNLEEEEEEEEDEKRKKEKSEEKSPEVRVEKEKRERSLYLPGEERKDLGLGVSLRRKSFPDVKERRRGEIESSSSFSLSPKRIVLCLDGEVDWEGVSDLFMFMNLKPWILSRQKKKKNRRRTEEEEGGLPVHERGRERRQTEKSWFEKTDRRKESTAASSSSTLPCLETYIDLGDVVVTVERILLRIEL